MKSVLLFLSKLFWLTNIQCVNSNEHSYLIYVTSINEENIKMDPVNHQFEMFKDHMKPKRIPSKKEWCVMVTCQL